MFKFKKATHFLLGALIAAPLMFIAPYSVQAASYSVMSGDTIYKISKLFNTTTDVIMKNNGITGSTIYPGQILNVPSQTYTVKSGDSLYLISVKCGISLYTLRKINNKWDDYIYPGQKLNLPMTSTVNNVQASSSAIISYSSSDLNLLARLITAEAQGEPYSAQVAVGAVVLNRLKNPNFPKTLAGVIYEKDGAYYQFTPVENGWINKTASSDSLNAAYDALHGSDPSHGALYYFDNTATNKWLLSKPVAAKIGNLTFSY